MFTVVAGCSSRSRIALAIMAAPKTSPQAPGLWLPVSRIAPRS